MNRLITATLAGLLALAPAASLAQPPKPAYVTGNPATGALAKASGSQSFTTGDLSGDCTTSATLAVICLKTNGISFGAFATGTDAANLTGTLNLARFGSQTANALLAGPSSGSAAAPSFRALVAADIPSSIITEAKQSLSDVTTANVTSSAHGYAPKSPADATKFLNGATTPTYVQVKDSDLSVSDVTTNNASTSAHGFVPKLPNDATKYYDGTGAFSVPAGGGGGGSLTAAAADASADTTVNSSTFTDITGAFQSLAAGTYLIEADLYFEVQATANIYCRIFNSTDSTSYRQTSLTIISSSFTSGGTMSLRAVPVVLSGTKTVKLQCSVSGGTWSVKKTNTSSGSVSGTPTSLMTVKIG
jgi:hypothetical protein